ncbi:MAG TPA: arabinofuranosyltransferase [Nocardioidaceae bacterium]|nr:arabinofuranosyltransferase [Nocardioidaceae bacterium]
MPRPVPPRSRRFRPAAGAGTTLRASPGASWAGLLVTSSCTAAGLAVLWLLLDVADLGPSPVSPLTPALLNGTAAVLAVGLGAGWCLARRRRLLADLTVVAVALYVSGTVAVVLSDTPWGLYGLFGDQSFRTEAVTRFTQTIVNADYAYADLPGHYPPLIPWLEARAAVLLDRPGWQLVKVGQVVLSAAAPVLAYALWCRVSGRAMAAAVVAVTTLFVADPYKIDQWLVLALLLPWWLDAFRGVTRPGARRWPVWLHGIVAGLLLTGYTFYFVPMALATVAGVVVDAVRGRAWWQSTVHGLAITGMGLVVSAWYWLPLALLRLQGEPTDDLQLRWFQPKHAEVVSPFEASALGVVMTLGVLVLAAAAVRHRVCEGLALAAGAGYAVLGGGLVLTALGKPVLAFKAEDFVVHVLVAAAAVGLVGAARVVAARVVGARVGPDRRGRMAQRRAVRRLAAAALTLICLSGALHYVDSWAQGRPVGLAHATALPDGSLPAHADEVDGNLPGTVQPQTSVAQITAALGIGPTDDPVVATTRVDLLATTAVHPFTTWWSIYSNPFGQFEARVRFLAELADSADAAELARRAQHNPYDPIDGWVLRRRGDRWTYLVRVDNFPDGVRGRQITFDAAQFDHPHWEITKLGDVVVVTSLRG